MIDGFRYGFFGIADVSPWRSLAVVAFCRFALGHRAQDAGDGLQIEAVMVTPDDVKTTSPPACPALILKWKAMASIFRHHRQRRVSWPSPMIRQHQRVYAANG